VRAWLSHIDKDAKDARNPRIFDLWLACWTEEEIGETVGCDKATVSRIINDLLQDGNLAKLQRIAALHQVDFDPPLYNIWKQQTKTPSSSHFGNSEVRWLDNLLYLYTQPFDVTLDPFAGSGSTIDICKKRFRQDWRCVICHHPIPPARRKHVPATVPR
jgi:hypothetical protein